MLKAEVETGAVYRREVCVSHQMYSYPVWLSKLSQKRLEAEQ